MKTTKRNDELGHHVQVRLATKLHGIDRKGANESDTSIEIARIQNLGKGRRIMEFSLNLFNEKGVFFLSKIASGITSIVHVFRSWLNQNTANAVL